MYEYDNDYSQVNQSDDYYGEGDYDDELFGDYTTDRHEVVGAHWLCGLIAAGLACVLALACAIMGWILFDHWKNGWMLAFAIVSTLAVLILAYCAFWCFNNNRVRSVDAEYHPPALTELAVWILTILLLVFFFVAGVAMFVYSPFHETYMKEKLSDNDYWNRKWGKDFDTEWNQERNCIYAMGVLSLIIFVLMVVLAFNTYSMSIKSYNLSVTMFLLSALAAFCFAFGVVVHYKDIQWWLANYSDVNSYLPYKKILLFLFILAIIVIILAFLNVLLGFIQSKFFHYCFIFLILLACILGAICWADYGRSLRNNLNTGMWNNGREILRQTHKDHVKEFCDYDKYVGNNTACTTSDFVEPWETGDGSTRALNQNCYGEAARFFPWKYFVMFLLVGFMVLFLAVLTIMNLFLLRDPESEKSNTLYLAILGLMALIGLALALYLIFGYKAPDYNTYPKSVTHVNNKFTPISKTISESHPKTQNMCTPYTKTQPFLLNGNKDAYGRLAILTQNSKFSGLDNGNLDRDGRLFFFNDNNSNSEFYLLKGTQEEINNQLKKSQLCISNANLDADAYFKYELVEADQLNEKGLKPSENDQTAFLTPDGDEYNGSNVARANRCSENCLVGADLSSEKKRLFKIPLVVQNKDGSPGLYTLPETGLRAKVFAENDPNPRYAMITNKSQIAFEAHTFPGSPYTMYVATHDKNGYYINNVTKVVIPASEQIDSEATSTDLSKIVLLTKNGEGCAGDVENYQQCIAEGKDDLKYGDLTINTFNAVTGEEVDEQLLLSHGHANAKHRVENLQTTNGSVIKTKLGYGPYNLTPTSDEFETVLHPVSLQSGKDTIDVFLVPVDPNKKRIVNVTDADNANFDMKVMMQNSSNDTCTVSAWNKSCPGAQMKADYIKNKNRVQVVDVDTYQNANYMTFVAPSMKSSSNCALNQNFAQTSRRLSLLSLFSGWNLGKFSRFSEMFRPMRLFDSDLTRSSFTNTYSTYNPFVYNTGFKDSQIVPMIGKEPNYFSILGMIDNNYSNQGDRNSILGALTNNDTERTRIYMTGRDQYSQKPYKENSWLNSIGDVFNGQNPGWKPSSGVDLHWNENASKNQYGEKFDTGNYNMEYWPAKNQEPRKDLNEVFGLKNDPTAWYCGYFFSCNEPSQQAEIFTTTEEEKGEPEQPEEPLEPEETTVPENPIYIPPIPSGENETPVSPEPEEPTETETIIDETEEPEPEEPFESQPEQPTPEESQPEEPTPEEPTPEKPTPEEPEEPTPEEPFEPAPEEPTPEEPEEPAPEEPSPEEKQPEEPEEPKPEEPEEPQPEEPKPEEPEPEPTPEPEPEPTPESTPENQPESTPDVPIPVPVPVPTDGNNIKFYKINFEDTTTPEEPEEPEEPDDPENDTIYQYLVRIENELEKNAALDTPTNSSNAGRRALNIDSKKSKMMNESIKQNKLLKTGRIRQYISNMEGQILRSAKLTMATKNKTLDVLEQVKKNGSNAEINRWLAEIKMLVTERMLSAVPGKHFRAPAKRKLIEEESTFRVFRCFTGYGYKSTVLMNLLLKDAPDMSLCKKELDSKLYSLANLNRVTR